MADGSGGFSGVSHGGGFSGVSSGAASGASSSSHAGSGGANVSSASGGFSPAPVASAVGANGEPGVIAGGKFVATPTSASNGSNLQFTGVAPPSQYGYGLSAPAPSVQNLSPLSVSSTAQGIPLGAGVALNEPNLVGATGGANFGGQKPSNVSKEGKPVAAQTNYPVVERSRDVITTETVFGKQGQVLQVIPTKTSVTEKFVQTPQGLLFAVPKNTEKAEAFVNRVSQAGTQGIVTPDTVQRISLALGLGGVGSREFKEVPSENIPVTDGLTKQQIIDTISGRGQVVQSQAIKTETEGSKMFSAMANVPNVTQIIKKDNEFNQKQTPTTFKAPEFISQQGYLAPKPTPSNAFVLEKQPFLTPEKEVILSRSYAEGLIAPKFQEYQEAVKNANPDIVGDIASPVIGFAGGLAQAGETALRAPIVATKLIGETLTQGKPSKETFLEAKSQLYQAPGILSLGLGAPGVVTYGAFSATTNEALLETKLKEGIPFNAAIQESQRPAEEVAKIGVETALGIAALGGLSSAAEESTRFGARENLATYDRLVGRGVAPDEAKALVLNRDSPQFSVPKVEYLNAEEARGITSAKSDLVILPTQSPATPIKVTPIKDFAVDFEAFKAGGTTAYQQVPGAERVLPGDALRTGKGVGGKTIELSSSLGENQGNIQFTKLTEQAKFGRENPITRNKGIENTLITDLARNVGKPFDEQQNNIGLPSNRIKTGVMKPFELRGQFERISGEPTVSLENINIQPEAKLDYIEKPESKPVNLLNEFGFTHEGLFPPKPTDTVKLVDLNQREFTLQQIPKISGYTDKYFGKFEKGTFEEVSDTARLDKLYLKELKKAGLAPAEGTQAPAEVQARTTSVQKIGGEALVTGEARVLKAGKPQEFFKFGQRTKALDTTNAPRTKLSGSLETEFLTGIKQRQEVTVKVLDTSSRPGVTPNFRDKVLTPSGDITTFSAYSKGGTRSSGITSRLEKFKVFGEDSVKNVASSRLSARGSTAQGLEFESSGEFKKLKLKGNQAGLTEVQGTRLKIIDKPPKAPSPSLEYQLNRLRENDVAPPAPKPPALYGVNDISGFEGLSRNNQPPKEFRNTNAENSGQGQFQYQSGAGAEPASQPAREVTGYELDFAGLAGLVSPSFKEIPFAEQPNRVILPNRGVSSPSPLAPRAGGVTKGTPIEQQNTNFNVNVKPINNNLQYSGLGRVTGSSEKITYNSRVSENNAPAQQIKPDVVINLGQPQSQARAEALEGTRVERTNQEQFSFRSGFSSQNIPNELTRNPTNPIGGGGGSPSGFGDFKGFTIAKLGFGKSKGGLFPDPISVSRAQKRTGHLAYGVPSTKQIKSSAQFKKTFGVIRPTSFQLNSKNKRGLI